MLGSSLKVRRSEIFKGSSFKKIALWNPSGSDRKAVRGGGGGGFFCMRGRTCRNSVSLAAVASPKGGGDMAAFSPK